MIGLLISSLLFNAKGCVNYEMKIFQKGRILGVKTYFYGFNRLKYVFVKVFVPTTEPPMTILVIKRFEYFFDSSVSLPQWARSTPVASEKLTQLSRQIALVSWVYVILFLSPAKGII